MGLHCPFTELMGFEEDIDVCAYPFFIVQTVSFIVYDRYLDILTSYHTWPKIWISQFYYLLMCIKLNNVDTFSSGMFIPKT